MADDTPLVDANPVPFSEPPWLMGLPSPYYGPSHRRFQRACREYISKNFTQYAMEWEKAENVPEDVYYKFAKDRMLVPNLPAPLPVDWLKKIGIHELPGGVKVEEFDYMHSLIYGTEMTRSGLMGPVSAVCVGISYGCPPIIKFGSRSLQERFLPDILTGKKRICIAITEPDAGSDVANIQTTAERRGDKYIVNGSKKWITNGIWSDYAATAVRTGSPDSGAAGISLLVVPLKGHKGVSMRRLKVSGAKAGGTTYIELDDVEVPAANLIGDEGKGMAYIMTNFNHERISISVQVAQQSRVALSAAFAYCLKREAFGAPLMNQPVVRNRLARAGAELESLWTWIESFLYQMARMPKAEADQRLGGLTALAKAKAGLVLNECAQCAVLLFGGAGFTQSGQGEIAEMVYRDIPGARIPGGSEDVMMDLAVRQLVKNYQKKAKELSGSGASRI